MSAKEYHKALRLGTKMYHTQISKGHSPYLPVLEQQLQEVDITARESLGVIDIPLDRVVGTAYYGREQCFTQDFLPIMEEESEFALKWAALCQAHIDEGIRDPIKAFEYMNRYYVIEGHKRVSVLKHFDAVSIRGAVQRLIPAREDTQESRIYYAFLDFYRLTTIHDVWFSDETGFSRLLKAVGKDDTTRWTDDERNVFRSFYSSFSRAFAERAEPGFCITAGDALLRYLNIFDYNASVDKTLPVLRRELTAMWDEIHNLNARQDIHVQLTPNERKPLFSAASVLPVRQIRLAFVHDSTSADSSWVYAHEIGRTDLEARMGDQIKTLALDQADTEEKAELAIADAAAWGADLIFTTSPRLLSVSVRAALENPKLRMLNCSLNTNHPSIRTYSGRMYEVKFLMGVIAGSLCAGDQIGYIADCPTYGAVANINAFALGAQMVNPRAEILLTWSKALPQSRLNALPQADIAYVSGQDSLHPGAAMPRKVGLYRTDGQNITNLALPYCHWGKLYEKIVRSYVTGSWKNDAVHTRAVNYWWGIDSEVVDLICTRGLPAGTKRLLELLKNQLCSHTFSPFSTLLHTQSGQLKDYRDTPIMPEELMTMDWLVSNVIGQIPEIQQMLPEAQQLMRIQGVRSV